MAADLRHERFLSRQGGILPADDGVFSIISLLQAKRAPDFMVRLDRRPANHGLTLIISGRGSWSSGGAVRELGPGSFYVSAQGSPIAVQGDGRQPMAIWQLSAVGAGFPRLVRRLLGAVDGCWELADQRRSTALFALLLDEVRSVGPSSQAVCRSLVEALLRVLARERGRSPAGRSAASFHAAVAVLEALPTGVLLPAVARACGLSVPHLCRLFRRHAGRPPMAWLRDRRLDAAGADLVAGGGTVQQVAVRHGWDDPFVFSRAFRRRFGQPPGRWRRQLPVGGP